MESTTYQTLELTCTSQDRFGQELTRIKTASQWFCKMFPDQAKRHGAPFLENRISTIDGFSTSIPVQINEDFMAGALGGDNSLGHSVIYWPPDSQFYYFDPVDELYHATTNEKLGDLMRAYFARCCFEMQNEINILPLFTRFRSDSTINAIVERAKSILRATDDYFSATSPYSRVNGIELHEKLARAFVEKMLLVSPKEVVLVGLAYEKFVELVKEKELGPIKRGEFKELMKPLIRERFGTCLRNDLVVNERYVQGWKDLALNCDVGLN